MKKLILLLIFILLIPFTLAICCQDLRDPNTGEIIKEGGCYPDRPICCEETNKIVGYVGCEFDSPNKCPGVYLGPCLKCSTDCKPDGTNCNWIEVDKCSGLSCVIEYLPGTKIPSIVSECSVKCSDGEVFDEEEQECIEVEDPEDVTCTDDMCIDLCCNEDGEFEEGEGSVCSGDNDNDEICNVHDNCEEIGNPGQEDADQDDIGDLCEFEGLCESAYGDRQCCDFLEGATAGAGQDYGKTEDCPGPLGCFSECIGTITDPEGNIIEIRYEITPCIDGQRTVKKIQNTLVIEETKEACSGIPLIPFFTTINLLFTFLILTLFYYFREK